MNYTVLLFVVAAISVFGTNSCLAEENNLLTNGGMERPVLEGVKNSYIHPEDWMVYAGPKDVIEKIGISSETKLEGKQSLEFRSTGISGAFLGIWMNVAVNAQKKYEFELYVLNNPHQPMHGNVRGEMSLEWKDATGNEIGRTIGPYWDKSSSKRSWKRYRIREWAPDGAVLVRLVITAYEGPAADAESSFFLDGVDFREK